MEKTQEETNYSALGDNPVCQKCGRAIEVGQTITQTFVGQVASSNEINNLESFVNENNEIINEDELVVLEQVYIIEHVYCPEVN